MGDAIDRMYEMSLWGYAMGTHVYPFFANGIALFPIATLLAMAAVWRLGNAIIEGDDEPMMAVLKWFACSLLVVFTLYNTIEVPLSKKATISESMMESKKAMWGTDKGRMPWISNLMDEFMDSWIRVAVVLSRSENRFLYVGSDQAAAQNMSSSDSLQDPQTRSILSQWTNVIAPSYILTNAQLAKQIKDEGLMDVLMYPVTTATDVQNDKTVERARRLAQILGTTQGLDVVGAVRSLSTFLNDPANRLTGNAMAVDGNETGVVAEVVGPYSTSATIAPATPPAQLSEKAQKAYSAGYRALTSITNDSQRQPKASYTNFADLYQAIGYGTDIALAKRALQNPDTVLEFGVTCFNRSDTFCKSALTFAPTSMRDAEDGLSLGHRLGRWTMAIKNTPGAAIDHALLQIVRTEIPLYIGAAKGLVVAMTPVILIIMLWPGRFVLGLCVMLGGYMLVGMWMCFYILWTFLVSDFMMGSGIGPITQAIGWSGALGNYPAMVKVLIGGYAVFGIFSFMVVFGGAERMSRSIGGMDSRGSIGGASGNSTKGAAQKVTSGAQSVAGGASKLRAGATAVRSFIKGSTP